MVFDRYNDDWERLVWVLVQGRASLVTDAGGKAQAVAALLSASCRSSRQMGIILSPYLTTAALSSTIGVFRDFADKGPP